MNEGLDEGAAERIQKEHVFLIKPSLSSLAHGDLKSLVAANKGRPDRSIKWNAAPSCRGPALRSVARQRAGASLHVSLWALICLRSRSLSADSHSFTGSFLSFLLSFFQFFLLPPPALHRRHSNVPRRLFSGQHQCHVACAESATQQPERTRLHLVRPHRH